MKPPVICYEYTTARGRHGYAVFAPSVPGLVVRNGNLEHASRMVIDAYEAVEAERVAAMAHVQLMPMAYRYNYV